MVLQSDEVVSHGPSGQFPVCTPLVCNTGFHYKHFKLLPLCVSPFLFIGISEAFHEKEKGFLLKQGNDDKARDIGGKKSTACLAKQLSYYLINMAQTGEIINSSSGNAWELHLGTADSGHLFPAPVHSDVRGQG